MDSFSMRHIIEENSLWTRRKHVALMFHGDEQERPDERLEHPAVFSSSLK